MRHAAITLVAILLFAMPVQGHHVEVDEAKDASDFAAQVVYIREVVAQRSAITDAMGLWVNAQSGPEKQDAILAVENVIEATLAHLDSLDIRECFRLIHDIAILDFDSLADAITDIRGGGRANYARANFWDGLLMSPYINDLLDPCSSEAP